MWKQIGVASLGCLFLQQTTDTHTTSLTSEVAAERVCSSEASSAFFDANDIALRLLGDSIYSNMLVLGACWKQGLIPLGFDAIMEAIRPALWMRRTSAAVRASSNVSG